MSQNDVCQNKYIQILNQSNKNTPLIVSLLLILKVDLINGLTLEQSRHRTRFDDLVPLYPQEKLQLENEELI